MRYTALSLARKEQRDDVAALLQQQHGARDVPSGGGRETYLLSRLRDALTD